jgi:hypothetical protein
VFIKPAMATATAPARHKLFFIVEPPERTPTEKRSRENFSGWGIREAWRILAQPFVAEVATKGVFRECKKALRSGDRGREAPA